MALREQYYMPLRIGSLILSNELLLAPMVKVTDAHFRALCRKQGAALTFSEMTHSRAIMASAKIRNQIRRFDPNDSPMGIQLAGNDPVHLTAAIQLMDAHTDVFDLNLGCPSSRTQKVGAGAALLAKPDQIQTLVQAMRKATTHPIMVKIRLPDNTARALDIADRVESAGADAITVHARTLSQGRAGDVNTALVAQIKEKLSIPVINNGGVWDTASLKRIQAETNCDGVMLARSALGNPGIFAQLLGQTPISPQNAMTEYLLHAAKDATLSFGRIKQQCLYFIATQPAEIKQRFIAAKSISELTTLASQLSMDTE